MARCNCSDSRCSCVIKAGANITIEGKGRSDDPMVISATGDGGGTGTGQWDPGDLKWSARAAASAGWLVADGSSVSRATFPALFAAIGIRFGPGDGVSTFNLPDYTGKFMLGADNAHPLGSVGGAPTYELTMTNIPRHSHTINHNHPLFDSGTAGGHNHTAQATSQAGAHTHNLHFSDAQGTAMDHIKKGIGTGTDASRAAIDSDGGHTHNVNLDPVAGHTHNVQIPAFAGDSGNAGALDPTPIDIMPPYTTALPLIKT